MPICQCTQHHNYANMDNLLIISPAIIWLIVRSVNSRKTSWPDVKSKTIKKSDMTYTTENLSKIDEEL